MLDALVEAGTAEKLAQPKVTVAVTPQDPNGIQEASFRFQAP